MKDQYGRQIDYMRVSVTDRCNLQSVYCMPRKAISFLLRNRFFHSTKWKESARSESGLASQKSN